MILPGEHRTFNTSFSFLLFFKNEFHAEQSKLYEAWDITDQLKRLFFPSSFGKLTAVTAVMYIIRV